MTLACAGVTVKQNGSRILHNVTFSAPFGRLTVITGPSGAGKTALSRVLSGQCQPNAGQITWLGTPIQVQPPHVLGSLPITLPQHLTPRAYLTALAHRYAGTNGPNADSLLQQYNLTAYVDTRIGYLSTSQLQALRCVAAFLPDAEVYVLDEPFAAADQGLVETLLCQLTDLRKRLRTVILFTHRPDLVRRITDHCYHMQGGEVLCGGTARGLECMTKRLLITIESPPDFVALIPCEYYRSIGPNLWEIIVTDDTDPMTILQSAMANGQPVHHFRVEYPAPWTVLQKLSMTASQMPRPSE